jgi:exodeoxyribonuclease-3
MKIATWNVNSLRARMEHLLKWIGYATPDVLCLQETKVEDAQFPREPLEAAGYACHFAGQKSYNGVAILTKLPASDMRVGLSHLPSEHPLNAHRRLLSATVGGVRVISAYFPNGEEVGSEKYAYKLEFLKELRLCLEHFHRPGEPLLLCGDFNIAPDDRDLYNPEDRKGKLFVSAPERAALAEISDFGLTDLFRSRHPEPGRYSWWDYRAGMYWKGLGMRLDHLWATEPLAARAVECDIDERPRRWKQPSDHAPVWATFSS